MFSTVLATYPLVPRRLFNSLNSLRAKSRRTLASGGDVTQSPESTEGTRRNDLSYVTFASVIQARREEAKRTIVVQVKTVDRR